ncbi:PK1L2-like protein, partial [Mya arenaria]
TDPSVVLSTTGGTFTILNSDSQLSQASTVTTLVIPGADGFGPTDSIIPNRYDCEHYKMIFSIEDTLDLLTVNMEIKLQGGLTEDDKPKCEVDWGDTLTDSINSYMEYTDPACKANINWTITLVNETQFIQFYNFAQPETSVLSIGPEILDPGEYLVCLEVAFPALGDEYWTTDCMAIRVYLPELIAHINGGEYLTVPHGDVLTIDATVSQDLITNLTSVTSIPMEAFWSFSHFPIAPLTTDLNRFQAKAPYFTFPSGHTDYNVKRGTEYALEVDTSMFPVGSLACAMFTLVRGDRNSSALQFLKFTTNALPLSIDCVYNCQVGRERKFNKDRVELDAVVDPAVDPLTLTFTWTIFRYTTIAFVTMFWPALTITSSTGFSSRSLEVDGLIQGSPYKIKLTVRGGGYATTVAEFVRTVNFLPYGGTCTLGNSTDKRTWYTQAKTHGIGFKTLAHLSYKAYIMVSARDWLTLTCENWSGNDERKTKGADNNPLLNFVVRQTTEDALVPVEPSYPVFDYLAVTPNNAGANLIKAYTDVKYPFDEAQLLDMGKSDMIISLISAVCSNLHLVELPVWTPPVPRVLNSGGSILDLNKNGNTDVGSLDEVSADANNETIDPATLAIHEVMHKMTSNLKTVVENDVSIRRKGDKYLTSIVSNGFNNIAAKSNFIADDTKVDLIFLADVLGFEALTFPENSTEDLSALIETSTGEIYYMMQSVVNAAVPDNLLQLRPVDDINAGREQGKSAAAMAIQLAQKNQDELRLCKTCSNENSTKTEQLVLKNSAENIANSTTSTKTSAFQLTGLYEAIANSSVGRKKREVEQIAGEDVSVSAFEFTENVYMYDTDGTSSYVTSNVLRIDVKTPTARVTPGYMVFEQTVVTPDAVTISPKEFVDVDDVSEFAYHRFIYGKASDSVCLIIEPIGNVTFESYDVYLGLNGPPSIEEYHLKFTVGVDNIWQRCIEPRDMSGRTGLVYYAMNVPGSVKDVDYNLTLITVGCLTWNEMHTKWETDKCEMEWKPLDDKIVCVCQEVTDLVFANSFFIAPNTIDFATVFLKFSPLSQAAVLGALTSLLFIYILAVLFLIGLDRRDQLKWGVTPLRDNLVGDSSYYLIKVMTGLRRGAGTTSRIAFVLTGAEGDTGPREMFDGVRKEFSTGSVMSFFMATKRPLGTLEHLYIWHDNQGDGDQASWYLNQVVVFDIEKRTTYTFVAEKWLSVETEVDANIPVTVPGKPLQFESRFFYQTRDRLSESHMWVSILYRPQTSTFTRVQRASCALVYICLTMIANAMYFNPDEEYESPSLIQVGPFRFTPQQVVFQIKLTLDKRCIYFAWTLFIAGTVVPAFFVLLYSMQWGKQKSEEWLTCFLMSMFESMLLVDPFMVLLIALVLACIVRTSRNDTNVDVGVIIDNYRKSLGETEAMPRNISPPLKGDNLEQAASSWKNEQGLIAVFKDIILNLFLVFIICSIAFSNRDNRSYSLHEDIINQFVTPWGKPHFQTIKTQGDMYNWLNVSVIPNLFPEFDINGSPLPWYEKKFIARYNTMRLGPPRLRQLRANNAVDIWGLPLSGFYTTYGGGGYIAQFDVGRNVSIKIVNELFRALWVDRQTRAVFFEFTLYSPATNMFIYNVFLIEFPQTGGAFTTYWVYPIRVYSHVGAIGTFTLICEVIFVIYLVIMLVKLSVRLYQKRMGFFSEFWKVYELVMFSLGVTSIVIYAIRLGFTYMTINKYKEDIKQFVNFSHIVFWDQILVACLSILVFMATFRILEVFATSKKVSALVKVFQQCGKDLFWYGMAFLHMFLGFCFLGFLLFGSHLMSYMTIFKCLGTLFIAMIGKSKFTEINETQPLLAKIYFIVYIFIIVFFVLSIFLSILGASIDNAVQETKKTKQEDLVELLIRKVKTSAKDASTVPNNPYGRHADHGSGEIFLTTEELC